jgi:hypothetical protein
LCSAGLCFAADAGTIALLHGKVYASPGAPPIENAVVLNR